jgi:hypothetical protein
MIHPILCNGSITTLDPSTATVTARRSRTGAWRPSAMSAKSWRDAPLRALSSIAAAPWLRVENALCEHLRLVGGFLRAACFDLRERYSPRIGV